MLIVLLHNVPFNSAGIIILLNIKFITAVIQREKVNYHNLSNNYSASVIKLMYHLNLKYNFHVLIK